MDNKTIDRTEILDELNLFLRMKKVYETQIINLKNEWKSGSSRYCRIKDYRKALGIWERRIAEYEERISELET
ncbi:hypothetical protein BSK59_13825 [Paenibacillus odorifer]|uniref:hypothetical protein n=1 Tax=Paenibacillus odorifer TaxID=189426 RepID=UPI00096DBC4C|nr:hypothetical protein [Paenibacillus odorifer]OME55550.1 hypothetical protein BSK59_13825 [Paenibacillus odorifer]